MDVPLVVLKEFPMSLIPIRRNGPPSEVIGPPVEIQEVEREMEVWKVSVFAEDGPNGKSSYSLLLELNTGSNPSNLSRRTEEVTGLALGVEEKEIPVLARLVGRKLGIFSNQTKSTVRLEDLERKVLRLQGEIHLLEEKNQALREQLQYAHESLHRISNS
jgi:hypothetical protein